MKVKRDGVLSGLCCWGPGTQGSVAEGGRLEVLGRSGRHPHAGRGPQSSSGAPIACKSQEASLTAMASLGHSSRPIKQVEPRGPRGPLIRWLSTTAPQLLFTVLEPGFGTGRRGSLGGEHWLVDELGPACSQCLRGYSSLITSGTAQPPGAPPCTAPFPGPSSTALRP